jgi:single-stranded DNA-specific DHH superfamily exonuclease
VADVAALHGLNRALVAQGLKVMARRENIGMAALIDASRLNRAPTCSDLALRWARASTPAGGSANRRWACAC